MRDKRWILVEEQRTTMSRLTDKEESRSWESARADLHLQFGKHSNRLTGMEASTLPA